MACDEGVRNCCRSWEKKKHGYSSILPSPPLPTTTHPTIPHPTCYPFQRCLEPPPWAPSRLAWITPEKLSRPLCRQRALQVALICWLWILIRSSWQGWLYSYSTPWEIVINQKPHLHCTKHQLRPPVFPQQQKPDGTVATQHTSKEIPSEFMQLCAKQPVHRGNQNTSYKTIRLSYWGNLRFCKSPARG